MKIAISALALLIAVLPMSLHAAPEVLRLEADRPNALELETIVAHWVAAPMRGADR